jgi:hypothetical protein
MALEQMPKVNKTVNSAIIIYFLMMFSFLLNGLPSVSL